MASITDAIYKEPATRFFDPECDNGTLYLTRDDLIYVSDGIECEVYTHVIPLNSIIAVFEWRMLGFAKHGIKIRDRMGRDERFIVTTDRKAWVGRIKEHMIEK